MLGRLAGWTLAWLTQSISSPESLFSTMAVTRPGPSAACTVTDTLPNKRYFVLTSVGASPAFHMPMAAPRPFVSRSRRFLSSAVPLSTLQKANRPLSQLDVVKSNEALPAKAASGGQPVETSVSECC